MKAAELRVDNLVLEDRCVCKVKNIYGHGFLNLTITTKQGTDMNARYETIQPIPLTEEWLLKFVNAEKNEYPNEIEICERFIFIWKESYNYWYVVTRGHMEYLTKIEYVHEYQNFYFALIGEELILTK
jgi:hypothetical protein